MRFFGFLYIHANMRTRIYLSCRLLQNAVFLAILHSFTDLNARLGHHRNMTKQSQDKLLQLRH